TPTAPTDIYTLSLHDALPIYPPNTYRKLTIFIFVGSDKVATMYVMDCPAPANISDVTRIAPTTNPKTSPGKISFNHIAIPITIMNGIREIHDCSKPNPPI